MLHQEMHGARCSRTCRDANAAPQEVGQEGERATAALVLQHGGGSRGDASSALLKGSRREQQQAELATAC